MFFVTERDYARLQTGQVASLTTDAFASETFSGTIQRIAPVFRESTRQARVELRVDNLELRLKPGMFVRATVILDRVEDAVIVPEQANGVKFERFVFDAMAWSPNVAVMEVARNEEFAPIKNASGQDSPATARRLLVDRYARWLAQAGVSVPRSEPTRGCRVTVVSPT